MSGRFSPKKELLLAICSLAALLVLSATLLTACQKENSATPQNTKPAHEVEMTSNRSSLRNLDEGRSSPGSENKEVQEVDAGQPSSLVTVFPEEPFQSHVELAAAIGDSLHVSQVVLISPLNRETTSPSEAELSLYKLDEVNGQWLAALEHVPAYVGKDGFGKGSENSMSTPTGIFYPTMLFGNYPDPRTNADTSSKYYMPYEQVDENDWWVADPNSAYYNQFVDASTVSPDSFDGTFGEHLCEMEATYGYCINFGYNEECVPEAGSAFFIHCLETEPYTEGCIAVSEEDMRLLVLGFTKNIVVAIGTEEQLSETLENAVAEGTRF